MRPLAVALVAGLVVAAAGARPPAPEAESWLRVTTPKGSRLIRAAGGPAVQVPPPPARGVAPDHVHLTRKTGFVAARGLPGGKRVMYVEEDPATVPPGEKAGPLALATPGFKAGGRRDRVVVADRDGGNPAVVLAGVRWMSGLNFEPDAAHAHFWAERDGKWFLFRVPLADPTPARLTRTGVALPAAHKVLADGRVLYQDVTGWEHEALPTASRTFPRGPVVLTDGKADTVVLKDWAGAFPEISDDGAKLAVAREHAVGVIELATGAAKEYPVAAFRAGWTCRVGQLRFRPDGRALAVGFLRASDFGREKLPAPGDEAVYHVGVVWLDGRAGPPQLIEIDPAVQEWRRAPVVYSIEWAAAPPAP